MPSLFRKYRPQRFADVAEQEHVVKTLTQQILQGSLAQVYLFSGPRGVGKTTIARLLAKSLQCTNKDAGSAEACGVCPSCTYAAEGKMMDTIEIDAASQTGVDAVRENIVEGVRFGPSLGKYKVFIIDEVHMLSTASFNALLKTLEEPPKFAIFILATTELHKIPATVLSRCQRFAFTRIPVPAMVERLRSLTKAEGRTVEESVFIRIARLSEGCLRDAESLLGQVFDSVEGNVTDDAAKAVLPNSSLSLLNTLMDLLAAKNIAEAAHEVKRASEAGASLRHVHDDFLEYVQAVVFAVWGDNPAKTYDEATAKTIVAAAQKLGSRKAVALLDALLAARLRQTPALLPELPLQVAFFSWQQDTCHPEQKPDPVPDPIKPQPAPQPIAQTPILTTIPSLNSSPSHSPQSLPTSSLHNFPLRAYGPIGPEATSPTTPPPQRDASIQAKWGRCLEKAKEAGPGYALMVGSAQFVGMESNNTLLVEFPYQMHADRMQDPKNSKILLDAIKEICLLPEETY
ncbi:MAG: DNA polymerase III subunit gamma/tau, partial [Patescibacteria group bacterium]